MANSVERKENRVIVTGEIYDFHRLLAQIHHIIEKLGYSEVVLDLGKCEKAYQNSMLSVCAQVMAYRNAGVVFQIVPPTEKLLLNLFVSNNWAHLLDPVAFAPSVFKGHTRIPATQYKTPSEQQAAVNKIVNVMLGAIPEMERSDFEAFEWSINELTDNVLVHSQSTVGGLVQVSTFVKYRKRIQFVVADAGIGIPASLRSGRSDVGSDTEALDMAIREGVTRDSSVGQGNGMFGSYEICSKSKGDILIDSGYARLKYDPNVGLSIKDQAVPCAGTLIVATLDFSDPGLLEDALRFRGGKHSPFGYVEAKYESNADGDIYFKLVDESTSFGSRVSGKPVRLKLDNLLKMSVDRMVSVDFEGVPILSSSFADEVFGKMFLSIGPIKFLRRVKLVNMRETVEGLVNKAIEQRMKVGISDADE